MKKPEFIFFDSNVYINLLRFPDYGSRIEPLLQGAYLYVLNKIVLMELWSGVKTSSEENILNQHQRAFPLIGLEDDKFIEAGRLLSRMNKKNRMDSKFRRRITWDLLIALSAQQNNAILITENLSDFRLIQKWIDFDFMPVPQL